MTSGGKEIAVEGLPAGITGKIYLRADGVFVASAKAGDTTYNLNVHPTRAAAEGAIRDWAAERKQSYWERKPS